LKEKQTNKQCVVLVGCCGENGSSRFIHYTLSLLSTKLHRNAFIDHNFQFSSPNKLGHYTGGPVVKLGHPMVIR